LATADKPISIASPSIGEAEKRAVLEVLESGQLAQGSVTRAFEEEFAAATGAKEAVAVNSGTAALIVALQAVGVREGDEVITTPFSFIATATSIIACGARPVFVDVEPFDGNIDVARVADAIGPRTKAVMPVHLYGHPARVGELASLCHERGLELVEDAAQAHGATHGGKCVGTFGVGCFSFYPTKNMTTGEGGMITVNNPSVAARARAIRNHGQTERYQHEVFGLNWRMTDIAAAIGRVQLERLGERNRARMENAAGLSDRIRAGGLLEFGVQLPNVRDGDTHVFHQYTVRIGDRRDSVWAFLKEAGVGAAVYYPVPIHRQPIFAKLGLSEVEAPRAEEMAEAVLSLPVHPGLTQEDLDQIVDTLAKALRGL